MNNADGSRVAVVRRFNRFYTRQIGLLDEGLLQSPFSLTESRVLYELANRDAPTASELARDLGLDAGYLSRILRSFEARGLIDRIASETDGRQHHLHATEAGRAAFAPLDRASQEQVAAMLDGLGEEERTQLTQAMGVIEELLGSRPATMRTFLLRPHRPGDMGYVVGRHGAIYAEEYGWDITFEALVAEIVAQFVRNFDARRECCLIAEIDGSAVGSVFVVRHTDRTAKLRLLLVEPSARNAGLGGRLVAEAVRFAKAAGYAEMTLWTQSILIAARSIYQKAGFRLIKQEPHTSFGKDLIGETWERTL
jgi:DNA-binding MarR family transcriptional regulator/N-acetylglutamate synthase-like GNAT family acetyltransferase